MIQKNVCIKIFLCVCFISAFISTVCRAERLTVFVSIAPQEYFADKIAGNLADVFIMVKPGQSPAIYEPKPKQMTALAKASVYFAIGVEFEKRWLDSISAVNKDLLIVHTDEGIEKLPMISHLNEHNEKAVHQDHNEHKHVHGTNDPHIWTSPPAVKIQAANILKGFVQADIKNKAIYEENYRQFIAELDLIDSEIRSILADLKKDTKFMVFHPAWGYFADTYGLIQIPVEIEGKEPKPAQLMQFIKIAKDNEIKAIFVQPQFSDKTAQIIANYIGGKVIIADPLAKDWAQNLKKQAIAFREASIQTK